ncbi:hypothetical protein BO86DRAFT_392513 [Aspergillus japonicus CBS 114.51]|uniref:Uncharacterized protein n=1 Tax=Aspergillus japonicus CBS 114.51 TaxID=1448312 RepID=A0A8T8WP73_ASPJA|nr:hypothetical protein BO86DRAFT_392513 [Aspergillus japonicus CBS 114.51]RAH77591.1 hypothetical protein BO86DRAFT_392513 [Aspergillus japonicus CBS 114.51]
MVAPLPGLCLFSALPFGHSLSRLSFVLAIPGRFGFQVWPDGPMTRLCLPTPVLLGSWENFNNDDGDTGLSGVVGRFWPDAPCL